MAFENFLRTDVENTTEMKSRVLTLFQENHPAHTTRKLIWKEFKLRIVPVNYEAIVRGESSRRVETEQSENLIPIAYVNTFYERFMAGILSFDNDVEVPQKDNPFRHYNVQKTISEHADFLTFMNLARVNKPFKRICRILPKPVTKIKLVPGWMKIALHIFDEKINDWVIFEYVSRDDRCFRNVNGREDEINTHHFLEVFTKDFIFLVNQLGTQNIEDFIFDLNECNSLERSGFWETIPIHHFQAILAQIQKRVHARKLSLIVFEPTSYSVDYILIIMQYLDPECLEILRFEPKPPQRLEDLFLIETDFDFAKFAETEQWKAARRFEWFPMQSYFPEFIHLTGFETVETSLPLIDITVMNIKEAFLQVPPTNTFTISTTRSCDTAAMGHYLDPQNPHGVNGDEIFKFPIRDSNSDLVINLKDEKITVTTEDRKKHVLISYRCFL